MPINYPNVDMGAVAEVKGAGMLATWRDLIPVYDHTREFARRVVSDDAPLLVIALVERAKRLAFLLNEVRPTACTCDVDGPDGIECWKCEVDAALKGADYLTPASP